MTSNVTPAPTKKPNSGQLQVRIMLKLTVAFLLGIAAYALLAEWPAVRGSVMTLYTAIVLWVMIKG